MTRKGLLALIIALCFGLAALLPAYSSLTSVADAKTYSKKKASSKKKSAKKKSTSKKKSKSKKKTRKRSKARKVSAQTFVQNGYYLVTIPTSKRNAVSVQKKIQRKTGLGFIRTAKYRLQVKVKGNLVPRVLTASRQVGYKAYVTMVAAPAPPTPQPQPVVYNPAPPTIDVTVNKLSLTDKLKAGDNSKIIVAVDAGHGGGDPGACATFTRSETETISLREKDINLDVALKLEALLKVAGYNVVMTRRDDVFIELGERANIANRVGADIFVSVHHNSMGTNQAPHGTEVFSYPGSTSGATLAKAIQGELVKSLNTYDRGTKTADLSVLRNTIMTAALSEAAFVSNPDEAALLVTDQFRQQEAQGIFNGITNYFYRLATGTSL